MNLRPYQEDAADFLFAHDRAMVLAPVGAGKTLIALTAMRDAIKDAVVKRWLVLAPKRVATDVWPVEAKKWAPDLQVRIAVGSPAKRATALEYWSEVVVVNYDNLQWLCEQKLDFDGVVFDELTRLKNPSGARFKALNKVIEPMRVRWGLTGSFTSNGLEDVFGQCKIVDQRLLGRSKGAFLQQYFYLINREFNDWQPRPGALAAVMDKIRPATYVLEPGEYKDKLPELHTVLLQTDMDDRKPYDDMKKDFVAQFPDAQAVAVNAAVVTQKLQQLAAGFIYTDGGVRWVSSHKLDRLEEVFNENQRAPTIVWYQFVGERTALKDRFPRAVDVRDKGAIDDWNSGKIDMLLAHPASAGHGLNLQHGGCRMVWLSLPWSLEFYEQAVGRLHRSGQRHDVWNYVLMTNNTVDQKIWAALHDKRSVSDVAMDELKLC